MIIETILDDPLLPAFLLIRKRLQQGDEQALDKALIEFVAAVEMEFKSSKAHAEERIVH